MPVALLRSSKAFKFTTSLLSYRIASRRFATHWLQFSAPAIDRSTSFPGKVWPGFPVVSLLKFRRSSSSPPVKAPGVSFHRSYWKLEFLLPSPPSSFFKWDTGSIFSGHYKVSMLKMETEGNASIEKSHKKKLEEDRKDRLKEEKKQKEQEMEEKIGPPPEKPLAGDCCGQGCEVCVWDTYWEELDKYNELRKKAEELG